MQFTNTLVGLAAVAVTTVNAQAGSTIKVTVGAGGVLQYSPNSLAAEVGTAIEFDFFPKNHSVIQSSFANPCHPLAGGFFSEFVPTKVSPSGTSFTIIVNDTKPIWFYCGQTTGNHCQTGMVGAINAPASGNNTFDHFVLLAKNATTSTSPPGGAVGGVLNVSSNSTSSSSSSSSISESSSAYTTQAYTSVYTSNSATYTVTATTTLFTVAPAQTTASGAGASSTSSGSGVAFTGAASSLSVFNIGAVLFAAGAAVMLC